MPRLPHISSVLSVLREPLVQVAGFGGALLALVGVMSDGFTAWSWLQDNWSWVMALPRHGWFYWGLILGWFAWLWWAALRIEGRQRRVAEAETSARAAALAELRGELEDLMALPLALASVKALEDSHQPFTKALTALRDGLAVYRTKVDEQRAWVHQQGLEIIPPRNLDTPARILPGHADRILNAVSEARRAMGELAPFHAQAPERPPLLDNLEAVKRYVGAHHGLCMACSDELTRLSMASGNVSRELDEARGHLKEGLRKYAEKP